MRNLAFYAAGGVIPGGAALHLARLAVGPSAAVALPLIRTSPGPC